MAAFKLKASIKAVSCNVKVLPTLRTSIPSVCIPTLNSGCSRIPRSIISAMCFKAGAKSLSLKWHKDKRDSCEKALSGIAEELPVIAQRYIIRQMWIVTNNLLRGIEFA